MVPVAWSISNTSTVTNLVIMSFEGLGRILGALALASSPQRDPDASLKRRHASSTESSLGAPVSAEPKPSVDLHPGELSSHSAENALSGSESVKSAFQPVITRGSPSLLDHHGGGNTVSADYLVNEFWKCMSAMMEEKLGVVLSGVDEIRQDLKAVRSSLDARLTALEKRVDGTEKSHMHVLDLEDSVRDLEGSMGFLSTKYDEAEIRRKTENSSQDVQRAAGRSLTDRMDNVVKSADQALATLTGVLDQKAAALVVEAEDMKKTCQDLDRRVQVLETQNRTPSETVTAGEDCTVHTWASTIAGTSPSTYGPGVRVKEAAPAIALPYESIEEHFERFQRQSKAALYDPKEETPQNVLEVCTSLMSEPVCEAVVSAERLGAPSESSSDGPVRHRPVLVTFATKAAKLNFLKGRFKLECRSKPVFAHHDLTPEQQRQRKKMLPVFKELRSKGIKCIMPFGDILDGDGNHILMRSTFFRST